MVIVTGCGNNSAINQAKVQTELDSTDYEIISAAFDEHFPDYKSELLIAIDDSTFFKPYKQHISDKIRQMDSNDAYLSNRVEAENKRRYSLDSSKIVKSNNQKIFSNLSDKERRILLDSVQSRPEYCYIYFISKPSYYQNKAAIGIYGVGWDTYPKYLLFFKKENSAWVLYNKVHYEYDAK